MIREKICVITCYKDVNYVRGSVLRNAVARLPEYELISVKNNRIGIIRYFEVISKLFLARIRYRPDIYILTFRGYEILPFVRVLTLGKKLIFDEFINLIEWTVYEHKKIKKGGLSEKILGKIYRLILLSTAKILTDTNIHAKYSANLMGIPNGKYAVVPVGADEHIFQPSKSKAKNAQFEVFYYGNMLPLHGLEYVCQAAKKISDSEKDIHFTIIGSDDAAKNLVGSYVEKGARITYINRVPLQSLVDFMHRSDLCLGGPFGDTVQSRMVITGKTFQFLACKKPTIIGKIDEKTPFKDKQNCLLVNQASFDELADAIRWAFKNKEKLSTIGERGHKLYNDQYSNPKISARLASAIAD